MILKIRGSGKGDWWVYGEIARIHYEVVEHDGPVTEDYDLLLFDEHAPTCLKIILRFVNGDIFTILTDTVAYLCNEQGNTIEKLKGFSRFDESA